MDAGGKKVRNRRLGAARGALLERVCTIIEELEPWWPLTLRQAYYRANNKHFPGRPTRILYLGDLDPSGWFMFPHSLITLRDEMDLGDLVQHVRLGLNPEQVEEHNLPQDPTAFKEADANAKRYRAIHGELAVELDALHPKVLTALAMEGIEANLDLDRLAATRQRQEQGRDRLKELAQKARRAVRDALGGDYE